MEILLEQLKDFKKYQCPAVYKITNEVTGKIYIGKSTNFYNRYKHHKYNQFRLTTYISRAFCKYGFHNFSFEIIELPTKELLSEREQYYLDSFQSYKKEIGYNIRSTVDDNTGFKHSNETKAKISAFFKGKPSWNKGLKGLTQLNWSETRREAMKKRMYGGNNPNAKKVSQYDLNGNFIKEYPSCREASEETGANSNKIAASAGGYKMKKKNGKVYIKKTAGGYIWKYSK